MLKEDLISDFDEESDESQGRLRSKSWIESIRYSRYTVKKKEEKEKQYEKMPFLIGFKKVYKDNKFNLSQLTIVAEGLIHIVHKKKEKRKNKEITRTETITIKNKPVKTIEKKPIKIKREVLTIERILEKAALGTLTEEETKRLDMYIKRKEFEEQMKQRMEEKKEIGRGAR